MFIQWRLGPGNIGKPSVGAVALGVKMGQMSIMRRTSLVHAKAHLSELVGHAEHKGKPVIILRHGKPAAAIVPMSMVPADNVSGPPPIMSDEELEAFWSDFGKGDKGSAVADLVRGRRPCGER